ncbi:epoxide hydrolase 1 [Danio rerio]|uniref:Epoxide hydrolase n=1 Tax=Danio rerio TaxID=7955 RepID=Q7ZVB4_DANRE|nr:epoxide hydrolase 1 [Danio rerio]AAH45930.1 Zgc:56126 [Danio rerio]AAI65341.1 Zgc:56126 protein [Danio rerio]|eukprot:NP_957362.1 epoxide hydrolase 1 [Danio rerio]
MYLEVIVALGLGLVVALIFLKKRKTVLKVQDGWWGVGTCPQGPEDDSIRPFKVETTPEEIEDLHRRLDQTRSFPSLEDSQFNYGFNSKYLEKVVSYWRKDFNWGKQLDKLNKYPHFKTKIEGIDIHYVHVKPKNLPEGTRAVPLMMVHGWPGSFYEFYGIISLLTEPSNPDDITFEVICPSIPGYGFSEASHKKGFDTVCAAHIFNKLMKRLGFTQYYVQGGDWGSMITTNMAQLEPNAVKGLHINFAPPAQGSVLMGLSLIFGRRFPKLFGFTEHDVKRLFPCMDKLVVDALRETGYMHIQATKPDTAGRGLNDSPVGLAAYILEKFSTWTDPEFRKLEDGGLERKYSIDDLLTNVMIYWTSGCIISSMRFYKENFGKGLNQPHAKLPVHVPTGVASFPNELLHTPKLWVTDKYRNLKSYTPIARGGHFAAMEEPQLLAEDVQNFVKIVENRKRK